MLCIAAATVFAVASMSITHLGNVSVRSTVVGYVPYWDQDRGFADIVQHPGLITQASPWWYAPAADGTVVVQDPAHTSIDQYVITVLHERGIRVIPSIANHRNGAWDDNVVSRILGSPQLLADHVASVVGVVRGEGYDGIEIDYESLHNGDGPMFSVLVRRLASALHVYGKTLAVAVLPKTSYSGETESQSALDYRAIGAAADQIRVMAYDQHWTGSGPGPVAPIGWVERVLRWARTQVPRTRVLLGCPLYGYDWSPGSAGETATSADLLARAQQYGATIHRDRESQSPWYRYADHNGEQHEVWFEDATSLKRRFELARRLGVRGVALWRLGGVDTTLWSTVGSASAT